MPMTQAQKVLSLAGVKYQTHVFEHDPSNRQFGSEAAKKLGESSERIFKTLIIVVDERPMGAVIPVSGQLDLKAMARLLDAEEVRLAGIAEAERRTGYQMGGISPFGQKEELPMVVDATVNKHRTVFVSGGKHGLELEMSPRDLLRVTGASVAEIVVLD